MKKQSVTYEVKVQRQIKALQKRIRDLEYDIVYLKLQIPAKPNPIGFKISNNDKTTIT